MTRSAASQGSPLLGSASRVFFLTAAPLWPDYLFALAATEPDTPARDKALNASDTTVAQNTTESNPTQPEAATPEPEDTPPSKTGPSSSPDDSEDSQAANILPIPTPVNTLIPDKNGSATPGIIMANLTDLLPAAPADPATSGDGNSGDDTATDTPQTPSTEPSTGSSDPQNPSGNNATKGKDTDPPTTDNPTTPPKESGKAESSSNPTDKATEGTKSTPANIVADSSDPTSPPSAESILCAPLNTSAISVTYSNGTNVTLTAHAEGVLDITNDKNGSTIEVWDHDVGVDVNCTVVLPPPAKKTTKKKKPQEGTPTNTTVGGSGDGGANNGESIDHPGRFHLQILFLSFVSLSGHSFHRSGGRGNF